MSKIFPIYLCFCILYFSWLSMAFVVPKGNQKSIIIDTDAGADDAMAIMMLLSRPDDFRVEAITCVDGNTGVHNVSINVLKVLATMKRLDIPVYVGSNSGLVYYRVRDDYFGSDGFGDFEYPNPPSTSLLKKKHAAEALAELVKQKPGEITIMCIGPLTNLALASHINPDFFNQVKNIVMLGGAYTSRVGSKGPGMEFNIYTDPEGAASVFTRIPSNTSVTLLPVETLEDNCTFPMDWRLNTLGKLPNAKMAMLNECEKKVLNGDLWSSFDPSLSAVLINPNIVSDMLYGNPIVNTSTSRGSMKVDVDNKSHIEFITAVNKDLLKETLLATLS